MAITNPKWRQATVIPCPMCGAFVIQGFDADTAALMVTIGTTPIDPGTEPVVAALGYRTYTLAHGIIWRRLTQRGGRVFSGSLHVQHPCDRAARNTASVVPAWLNSNVSGDVQR